jgi:hypothetical protein
MSFLKRLFGGGAQPPGEATERGDHGSTEEVGIFAGLFVAPPQAFEQWDIGEGLTPADWPAIEFKRLDPVKMGTLESILTGVPYDDVDQDELHALVRHGGDEGPWIVRLRQPLIDALATLEDSRIREFGAAWADTDEFKLRPSDKPSKADIEDLSMAIGEMSSLARVSKERAEPMFLMMGL